jgi:hypothetical protein
VTDSKPEQLEERSTPPDAGGARPGAFTVSTLLVGIAAVIVAPLLPTSARHESAGLLIFARVTLIVLWAFTHSTESRGFSKAMTAIVIATLLGTGGYLLFVSPVKPAALKIIREPAPPPNAPKLYFELGTSARVPYCSAYAIQVEGSVPAGYQVVVFDAPTDKEGNVTGYYNFDQQPKPALNIPGRLVAPYITVGSRSPAGGFRAVVIAAVIADKEANVLEAVKAGSSGWGLNYLPVVLTSKELEVTRTSTDRPC